MARIIEIAKKIKIEEYVLIGCSLFFLILSIFFSPNNSFISLLKNGTVVVKSSIEWYQGIFLFFLFSFFFYITFRIYIFLVKKVSSYKNQKHFSFNFSAIKDIRFIIRMIIPILISFSSSLLMVGVVKTKIGSNLINEKLLNIDRILTGNYPFIWLHTPSNPLESFFDSISPVIIFIFTSLNIVIGISIVLFYLDKKRQLFKGLVISIFLAMFLSIPLWYLFPANSPSNAFLQNPENAASWQTEADYLNPEVKLFQKEMWERQKEALPITTMPSMHWAWTIIIVYFFFRKNRKTLFISIPWMLITFLGTVYLGCHYLIDGIVSVPLATLSIAIACFFVRIEEGYYKEDFREKKFKEKVKEDFSKPFQEIKHQLLNK